MGTRCLLIINPVAGGGKPTKYAMDLEYQLDKMFDHVEVKFTHGVGDATKFAQEATEKQYEAVFCMGGDGTVNETVNGIVKGGGTTTFGFVPVGTVNDLARALNIPLQPYMAIHMLSNVDIIGVDVGRCNDQYFCNNIAAGILPTAVEEVTPKQKALLGPAAYFVRGGQALLATKDYTFEVTIEDPEENIEKTIRTKSPLFLALMTNCVSSFEKFMPIADVDDGFMRLVIFKEYFFTDILRILPLILSGKIYTSKYVTILKTRNAKVRLLDDVKVTTNMDGSKGPALPIELEVLPQFLKVYVPKGRIKSSEPLVEVDTLKRFTSFPFK